MPESISSPGPSRFDVVIAGGGPAGAACAIALRRRGLTVTLLERGAFDAQGTRCEDTVTPGPTVAPSVGECLSAAAQYPLRDLGLWEAFVIEGHRPSYVTQSAWSSAELRERHAISHKLGPDLHVDRARFDAWLRRQAIASGAQLIAPVSLTRVEWSSARRLFTVIATTGSAEGPRVQSFEAPYVVDATGRAAWLTRRVRGRRKRIGDLVCIARWYEDADFEPTILVETTPDGWWYSAPSVGRRAIAQAFVLAADAAGARSDDGFRRRLAATRHTAPRLARAKPLPASRACLAAPALSEWDSSLPFLPVGDAAAAFDPISGSGLVFALRSALEAGDVIAEAHSSAKLVFGDYQTGLRAVFETHVRRRIELYAAEQRWVDTPFWSRLRTSMLGK